MQLPRLITGALAGCAATAPMTLAMEAMHRLLPQEERYPLPPTEITAELTEEAGVRDDMTGRQHLALTVVNHFAYGAAAGGAYALTADTLPLPAAVKGIVFGQVVWSVSYLGLLPALGLLRPATEHPARRNLLMILAHVVWGAATGLLYDRWRD